jgi:TM2 domain-containing membrane protein YozV
MTTEAIYTVIENHQISGPFTLAELLHKHGKEEFGAGAHYRSIEDETWKPLRLAMNLINEKSRAAGRTFHIADDGRRLGPFTEAEMRSRFANNYFREDALLWQEGMDDWMTFPEWNRKKKPAPAPTVSVTGVPLVKTQKSRGMYVILGLLFGGLGLHDFYAGHFARGAVMLILGIVGGIFTILSAESRILGCVLLGGLAVAIFIEICTEEKDGDGDPLS